MYRPTALFFLLSIAIQQAQSQTARKHVAALRTNATFKIDGNLNEEGWKNIPPITDFIELRPKNGANEKRENRTEVYMLYDNTSVYIGGYCHEQNVDSISKELVGRDVIGVCDFLGVIFDTYNDKINGSGFFVTPYGEQYDAKYSPGTDDNNGGEDATWNAVWESAAKIQKDGWTFEMRIPYSALRFNNKDSQTWGMNMIRRRSKAGQQLSWNLIDVNVSGLMNQEGEWTGIEKITPPLRLSLTPYISTYLNHYPYDTKGINNYSSSFNGGMDVKYGISQSFTLDMTLVPDFGQVQSDNQVLNLTPFEVKYNENRSFFTEGTELFNKGNLFYSRRIGGTPLHYSDIYSTLDTTRDHVIINPTSSRLFNAAKISGRTASGLGIGFFNAITEPTYATYEDSSGSNKQFLTDPLTNYNIIVLDQNLKNNSSVTFINTNVLRRGTDYNADVAAALFNFNNKKNTYNWAGKFAMSDLWDNKGQPVIGQTHKFSFSKTGGRFNFSVAEDLIDDNYNPNDLGFLLRNNYFNHYFYTGYHWTTPGKWYNNIYLNNNINYNRHYVPNAYESFNDNANVNGQLKNLMFYYLSVSYNAKGTDFYEPHVTGRTFNSPSSVIFNAMINTNQAKKYSLSAGLSYGSYQMFSGQYYDVNFGNMYRFSDKFSINQSTDISPFFNNVGYADQVGNDIIFSRRNRLTIENIVYAKYNFNNRSGITFRARHYWSRVVPQEYFLLLQNGDLGKNPSYTVDQKESYNAFTIDMVYTLQFAPGSFINIVYKNAIYSDNQVIPLSYFKDFGTTMIAPQNNSISLKVIYYLDFLKFRKKDHGFRGL